MQKVVHILRFKILKYDFHSNRILNMRSRKNRNFKIL